MSDYGRRPTQYLTPEPENLPANSVYNNVKVGDTVKPPPHLLRIFKTYVEKNVDNPQDLPEIDYHEFGKRWLALFNYAAHEDHTSIPLMDWISEIAGNPYRAVKIMKHVDGIYTEVARVPPIFDRMAPIMSSGDKDYFIGMAAVQSILHRGSGHIREADGFIERNLTKRIEVNRILTDNFDKMNDIFKLYGVERDIPDWIKELKGIPTTTTGNATNTPTSVVIDMEEDDDW